MEEVTKPKNPGRVAAGKRTAELNRKRKEDLLRNQKTVPSDSGSGAEEVPRGLELSGRAFSWWRSYRNTRRHQCCALSTSRKKAASRCAPRCAFAGIVEW